MTQCSKELDSTLEDLVRLVHCRSHDYGPSSESRVSIWIEAFPEGANAETSPVVVARKVRKTLGPTSTICAGLTKAGARCRSHTGGQKVQNCGRSIVELVRVDDYCDRALCELFLSVLEANRYCWRHVSQQSMHNVHEWLEISHLYMRLHSLETLLRRVILRQFSSTHRMLNSLWHEQNRAYMPRSMEYLRLESYLARQTGQICCYGQAIR